MCKRHISAPQGKVHRKNSPNQYRAIANAMITSAMSAASGIQQALISAHWDDLGLTESMRSTPPCLKGSNDAPKPLQIPQGAVGST